MDLAAKKAALQEEMQGALISARDMNMELPGYSEKDDKQAEKLHCSKTKEGWLETPAHQVLVTPQLMNSILINLRKENHMGAEAMVNSVKRYAIGPKMQMLVDKITRKRLLCCKNNPKIQHKPLPGNQRRGITPGEHWQVDFSELPKCNRYKYLLALVDTFSGWPEAFLCLTNRVKEVVRVLLKEIIPWFGIPEGLSSDNRPPFHC